MCSGDSSSPELGRGAAPLLSEVGQAFRPARRTGRGPQRKACQRRNGSSQIARRTKESCASASSSRCRSGGESAKSFRKLRNTDVNQARVSQLLEQRQQVA